MATNNLGMSVQRQYIGARYVMKIYENSINPLSAEWEANTEFEPLVMVTYNYGSYISKKNVPATIGNPVDNPSYWAQFGFYSGQISQLMDDVASLNEHLTAEISARITRDGQLTNDILAEIDNRETADTALGNRITDETTARTNADTAINATITALDGSLTAEVANRTSADANLQSQIDDLVAPSGSAPSEAEIINARTGADGVVYTSLGNAIRTQVGTLKDSVCKQLKVYTATKVDATLNENGTITSSGSWKTTELIPVKGYVIIDGTFTTPASGKTHIAFYDRSATFISGSTVNFDDAIKYGYIVVAPNGACFMRISMANTTASTLVVRTPYDPVVYAGFKALDSGVFGGGYLNADGTIHSSSSWKVTDYIPVQNIFMFSGSVTSLAENLGRNIAFYGSDKTFKRAYSFPSDVVNVEEAIVNVLNDEAYVRICTPNAQTLTVYSYLNTESGFNQFKLVSKTKDNAYRSITDAVNDSATGDTIIVDVGTYDNEHITAWGKEVNIIGLDRDNTVVTCNDNTYANPLIEMSCGIIKNLTLFVSGGSDGYALHSEDAYSANKIFTIDNCKIETHINASAVGIGMYGGSTVNIKNCEIVCSNNSTGNGVYIHDANELQYAGQFSINFDNNLVKTVHAYSLRLQSQSMDGSNIDAEFGNNTFYCNSGMAACTIVARVKDPVTQEYTNSNSFDDLTNWNLVQYSRNNTIAQLNA